MKFMSLTVKRATNDRTFPHQVAFDHISALITEKRICIPPSPVKLLPPLDVPVVLMPLLGPHLHQYMDSLLSMLDCIFCYTRQAEIPQLYRGTNLNVQYIDESVHLSAAGEVLNFPKTAMIACNEI